MHGVHALSKLNYRQTEMLWAVVMAGSISGAARLLNISQPAVSRMLAPTEKAMGVTLFEQVRGRLQPTVQVQSLFEEIEKTQRMMQRVNDLADALAEHGTGARCVASIPSLAQYLVARRGALPAAPPRAVAAPGHDRAAQPDHRRAAGRGRAGVGGDAGRSSLPGVGAPAWGAWWRPFRADTSWPGARWSAWLICRRIRTSSSAPACPTGCWC